MKAGTGPLSRRIGRLVLVRHGESVWNITNRAQKRETRFTGWADIPISQLGRQQAQASGRCLEGLNIEFDAVYTSLLQRARVTYELLLSQMPSQKKRGVPVVASWRLNERHYGALVGLSKSEAETKMGRAKVIGWRRSWDLRPPPMAMHPFYHSTSSDPNDKAPLFDWQSDIWTKALTIRSVQMSNGTLVETEKVEEHDAVIPLTESLEDTANRVFVLWRESILPRLVASENVLVVGHSNTIRAMVKQIDNLSETSIVDVVIPSAIPLVYNFAQDSNGDVTILGRQSPLGMRGRFVVTKELLELNLQASQNLEMSENLDEDAGNTFRNALTFTLRTVDTEGKPVAKSSFMDADLNSSSSRAAASSSRRGGSVMDPGWMTFNMEGEAKRRAEARVKGTRPFHQED